MSRYHYRKPLPNVPLRVAFIGQETYFRSCSLEDASADIEPFFIDFRMGADSDRLLTELEAVAPHVAIVFRPEIIPAGLFESLSALTIGFLTEPLPRSEGDSHEDLATRLGYLKAIDSGNFDRVVSFDPFLVPTVEREAGISIWRSLPLPVSDRLYRDVARSSQRPKLLFIGRSTEHREAYLGPIKHNFDLMHIAHGVSGEMLNELLDETDIAINLHNEPYPNFENRVCLHLAAGHFLISEPLSPTHGLEPGIDFYEVRDPEELASVVYNATHHPDTFYRMRVRGRLKAEQYRASAVYPVLVRDAIADVSCFSTERAAYVS